MHHKLHKVRENLNNDDHNTKVNEVHQIAQTLLQAKENSEIVQKEDLGQDVTKSTVLLELSTGTEHCGDLLEESAHEEED